MAEDPEKAALYLGLSGDKAHRRYSTREAYNNYSEALRALGRLPDTEEIRRTRLDLITSMAAVMWPLNYPEGCLAILQDGLGIAEGLGDRQAALGLSSMMSQAYAFAGDLAQATRCNQNAFDAAEALGDRITTLMVGINLSSFYFQSGNAVRAADVAGRAIALLGPPTPELEWYSALLFHIGGSRAMLGDFDEGESLLDQAVNGAADQYLLASSHFMYALVEVYRGRPQAVLNHAREARALCEKTGLNVFLGACWAAEAYGHYFINDLSAARVCAEKAVSLVLEHHAMTILPEAYMISGMIARGRGDLPEATRLMKAAVETAREGGMKQYEGLPVVALSSIMVEADKSQISAAELNITEGMGILEDLKLKPWLAVAHLYAGETYAIAAEKAKALANLNQARQMCQVMGMDYWLARTDRALEKLSG